MTLYVAGIETCALAEFGKGLACVIFLQGCDMKCGYCQNPELRAPYSEKVMEATADQIIAEIPWDDIDAISVTGGEPLWSVMGPGSGTGDLIKLFEHARRKQKTTNVDSNGLYTNEGKARVLSLVAPFLTTISIDIKHASTTYLEQMAQALRRAEVFHKARFRMVLYEGRWQKRSCIDSGVMTMLLLGIKKIRGTRNGMAAPMMSDEDCIAMQEAYNNAGIELVI